MVCWNLCVHRSSYIMVQIQTWTRTHACTLHFVCEPLLINYGKNIYKSHTRVRCTLCLHHDALRITKNLTLTKVGPNLTSCSLSSLARALTCSLPSFSSVISSHNILETKPVTAAITWKGLRHQIGYGYNICEEANWRAHERRRRDTLTVRDANSGLRNTRETQTVGWETQWMWSETRVMF